MKGFGRHNLQDNKTHGSRDSELQNLQDRKIIQNPQFRKFAKTVDEGILKLINHLYTYYSMVVDILLYKVVRFFACPSRSICCALHFREAQLRSQECFSYFNFIFNLASRDSVF